jgi:hypothetical protein
MSGAQRVVWMRDFKGRREKERHLRSNKATMGGGGKTYISSDKLFSFGRVIIELRAIKYLSMELCLGSPLGNLSSFGGERMRSHHRCNQSRIVSPPITNYSFEKSSSLFNFPFFFLPCLLQGEEQWGCCVYFYSKYTLL